MVYQLPNNSIKKLFKIEQMANTTPTIQLFKLRNEKQVSMAHNKKCIQIIHRYESLEKGHSVETIFSPVQIRKKSKIMFDYIQSIIISIAVKMRDNHLVSLKQSDSFNKHSQTFVELTAKLSTQNDLFYLSSRQNAENCLRKIEGGTGKKIQKWLSDSSDFKIDD